MKVLLINTTDTGGGAAIAAVRILNSLNKNGIYARLGVEIKNSNNPNIFELPKKKNKLLKKILYKTIGYLGRVFHPIIKFLPKFNNFKTTNEILHSTNYKSETDVDWINNSDYDVINLHWISGTICNKDIAKITKPIIWTMHDTWPFCGAEHYPNILEHDERYKHPYTRNNKPNSTKGIDLCRKVWLQKNKYLSNKNITFISPSNWEAECIKESSLFSKNKCYVIHNVIPSDIYKKKDKQSIRKLLNIPDNKKVLGFGAAYGINNPRSVKGSFYLLQALQQLKEPASYFLLVFGDAKEEFTSKISIDYQSMGFVSNPIVLSLFYNACDVFICPSIVENLPNTCLESLFCGVPSVAFNSGGTKDIVEHKNTGYLAKPFDVNDLANGIEWCANNKILSKNCIEKALIDFDEKEIIQSYVKTYSSVL